MRGFSARNLKYMRAFAAAWPEQAIVQEALAQIPWSHQIALLEKKYANLTPLGIFREWFIHRSDLPLAYIHRISGRTEKIDSSAKRTQNFVGKPQDPSLFFFLSSSWNF